MNKSINRPADGRRLLAADEPPPFIELGRQGRSNFVIVVDHAGRRIPRALGDLGLPPAELDRHIAWDIGALGVARRMAAALDAPSSSICSRPSSCSSKPSSVGTVWLTLNPIFSPR